MSERTAVRNTVADPDTASGATLADSPRRPDFEQRQRPLGPRLLAGVGKHCVLIGLSVIFLIPLVWMVTGAFKTAVDLNASPIVWFPDKITFDNFVQAAQLFPLARYFFNTFVICVLSMLGAVFSSAMVGYGLARIPWRGRNVLFVIIISTMMIPFYVTMFPAFEIWRSLHLTDTWVPLILPHWLCVPIYIFLLRQFLMTIPKDLSESARIDGAGEWQIFTRVILPLIKPALVAVGLFQFLASWNDFLGPLIYLSNPKLYTISLGLNFFKGEYATEFGPLMAVSALAVLPIVIIFFFAQRTFIEGITLTGVKG
ncbi:carbohydrate ABC transporter permease [Microlunatus panaciterrae]|uniref:Multiple sugar transport system permease protein n=1 Tax=Microlunatus panaciterrae TaxID=400768 RepID=A0ABS2RK83_9ACTN|nr:carbohydrate ABC transporter permease [Microlunatus panaciterrae]MBM7798907.1 multiple sugar transport system permease protein [Microlunatus panaciterrae]